MSFNQENQAKADFDNVYTAPTPHAYLATMRQNGYAIGERARPYFAGAAELLREHNGETWPVQMLDIGCSYGVGSALVKYGCSFDELVAFFATRAPEQYDQCTESTRLWLNATPPVHDVRVVGMDASEPAIRFATSACLLEGGITTNLEQDGATPTEPDVAWIRSCNLLVSSGAIGYVTSKTLDHLLPILGKDYPGEFGPLAVITVLRMFETETVRQSFESAGFRFGQVPDVYLAQRRFVDDDERDGIVDLLHSRGMSTAGLEDEGVLYANLFIGGLPQSYDALLARMGQVAAEVEPQPAPPEPVSAYQPD